MREGKASQTAAWVAALRTLGQLLPEELVLARDPYGLDMTTHRVRAAATLLSKLSAFSPRLLTKVPALAELLLWLQLRTRFFDDVLLEYLRLGGRQVVLLGAGYDTRSLRFEAELRDARVYEVDHPDTQREKQVKLPSGPNVRYLPWNFENDALCELPRALQRMGLDPTARTLTIWEGVTMYLTRGAIDASMRCVHELGCEGSLLAFNYKEERALRSPKPGLAAIQLIVKRVGEPYRSGLDPRTLPRFLSEHGFSLTRDASDTEIANEYWPLAKGHPASSHGRRLAVARRGP